MSEALAPIVMGDRVTTETKVKQADVVAICRLNGLQPMTELLTGRSVVTRGQVVGLIRDVAFLVSAEHGPRLGVFIQDEVRRIHVPM